MPLRKPRRQRSGSSNRPLRLDSGEVLLTYEQAARRLDISEDSLETHWLRAGWLKPSHYRQGSVRFINAEDVDRAAVVRGQRVPGPLYGSTEAAEYLGVSARKFMQLISAGRLREAIPDSGLYAQSDLDRVLLHLAGIDDPITKAEAGRLAGRCRGGLDHWVESGHVAAVKTGGRSVWVSRSAVFKLVESRRQQQEQLDAGVESGRFLRTPEAAKRLGISEVALFKAFKRGVLKSVEFDLLRRTVVESEDLERARAGLARAPDARRHGSPAWSRATGLPEGLLTVAQAAQHLGVTTSTVLNLVHRGELVAAQRGRCGKKAAYGFELAAVQALVDARRDELVTTKAAAALLGISPKQVKGLVHVGALQVAQERAGGWWLFERRDVQQLVGSPAVVRAKRERAKWLGCHRASS
jgi:excisionase family DNA binding protein